MSAIGFGERDAGADRFGEPPPAIDEGEQAERDDQQGADQEHERDIGGIAVGALGALHEEQAQLLSPHAFDDRPDLLHQRPAAQEMFGRKAFPGAEAGDGDAQ